MGGAKVSSKLGALENMLRHVDKFIIGGAMANTFLASSGFVLGRSLIEPDLIETAGRIMRQAIERGVKFYLPVDAVVADRFDPKAQTKIVPIQEIPPEWMALDIGPATALLFNQVLYDAKTVVWNGPLGAFEMDAFSRGTMAMVHSVAGSHALTIVGGGDTDVALHKSGGGRSHHLHLHRRRGVPCSCWKAKACRRSRRWKRAERSWRCAIRAGPLDRRPHGIAGHSHDGPTAGSGPFLQGQPMVAGGHHGAGGPRHPSGLDLACAPDAPGRYRL